MYRKRGIIHTITKLENGREVGEEGDEWRGVSLVRLGTKPWREGGRDTRVREEWDNDAGGKERRKGIVPRMMWQVEESDIGTKTMKKNVNL